MDTITVTAQNVVSLLNGIVERFGQDHKAGDDETSGCTYLHVQGLALVPVCIIGQLFSDLGILRALAYDSVNPFENYLTKPEQYGACALGDVMWERAREFGFDFTDDAQRLAHLVQQEQDNGVAWGNAVRNGWTAWTKEVKAEEEDAANHRAASRIDYTSQPMPEPSTVAGSEDDPWN